MSQGSGPAPSIQASAAAENVASKARVPKGAKVDTRERAVLTDDELVTYLAWEHPEPAKRAAVLERQTMACVSRMFGGLRLGDIRAIRWESFDVADGEFPSGWAPRKKTARPQLLEVPVMLRPILRDWWERAGRPAEGPVFPSPREQACRRAAQAWELCQDPAARPRACARHRGTDACHRTRSNNRPDTRLPWTRLRPPTLRERELLEETEFTRPVDFHSFRRAFKQALANAGVELQQAMALSGATDVKAHQRYLANTARMRSVPLEALPIIAIADGKTHNRLSGQNQESAYFKSAEGRT